MSRRKLTGKTDTLAPEQPQTIPILIQIVFVADGQQLGATVVNGTLPIPPNGQSAQVNIPLDARPIAQGLSAQLSEIDKRKARGGLLVPKPVVPSDLIRTAKVQD